VDELAEFDFSRIDRYIGKKYCYDLLSTHLSIKFYRPTRARGLRSQPIQLPKFKEESKVHKAPYALAEHIDMTCCRPTCR